jgi:hypothetical protein
VVVVQKETDNPNACALNISVFNSEDLSFLQIIVEELLEGLTENDGHAMEGDTRDALKADLARHVLARAHPGERDAASLKRRVMQSRSSAGR